ncbi:MAG: hypothetical protein QOF14_4510 [Hyphomicrobiales bacterium]|jgi:class 3 adenylate cyclase|nr:hypothetical protein [Hyphomicrobiales bacterium]
MDAPADPRSRALKEALERESATAEILQIIASSPADTQPVFDAIVRTGLRLFADAAISIGLPEGDKIRAAAVAEGDPARAEAWRNRFPFPLSREYMHGIAILDAKIVDIPDVANAPAEVAPGAQNFLASGYRAITIMPMMRGDAAIGALSVLRHTPGPLSDEQLALLKTFAAQAVIAIENTRLVNELRQRTDDLSESLEQQTATADVLRVISSSPSDLEPIFDAIVESAPRLCDATNASLHRVEGDLMRQVASHGAIDTLKRGEARPITPGSLSGRAIIGRKTFHVEDALAVVEAEFPDSGDVIVREGIRTALAVPLMQGETPLGAIVIRRTEVRPFSDKQISLLKTFADQAVIAIENARLFNELRQRTYDLSESLEQQTATSEILSVISNSLSDTQPVFDAIVQSGLKLFPGALVSVALRYEDKINAAAIAAPDPARVEAWRRTINSRTPLARDYMHGAALLDRRIVDIPDVADAPAEFAAGAQNFLTSSNRAITIMPMMRGDEAIGLLSVVRLVPGPLSDKQIAVLKTFAAQAVIAIENARLLSEVRQQASQLEAQSQELRTLNQGLEQRVDEQVGEIERVGRLRRFLPPQVADLIVSSGTEKQLESHRREITALFCDLRGFTGFSETSDPEDVMALLREYHKAIGEIIFRHGGTLERFAGDGVMVIFNDPVPLPNPALSAVQMALEMRAAIGGLIEKWRRLGHELGFGIGIAHGYATLGTIGFEGRFDYAAIGTVSNVASRLCDEAQPGQILVSPRVLLAVEDAVSVEPVREMALKGIRRPMLVHNVVGAGTGKP